MMPSQKPDNYKGAAIITGAARRIGRAIALTLAEHGFDIVLHYNKSHEAAISAKQIIEADCERQCLLYKGDLSDASCAGALMEKAFERFSHCNLLINNASCFSKNDFLSLDLEELDLNMSLHLRSPLIMMQYFCRLCRGQGHIINMLDSGIDRGERDEYFAYKLSKQALGCLSSTLSSQFPSKILVSSIRLGQILGSGKETNTQVDGVCKTVLAILASKEPVQVVVG